MSGPLRTTVSATGLGMMAKRYATDRAVLGLGAFNATIHATALLMFFALVAEDPVVEHMLDHARNYVWAVYWSEQEAVAA